MFKTRFEKYKDEVLKWLKNHKVDTERFLAPIVSIITDYYDDIDAKWAAQCIKAELGYQFGADKILKESVGDDVDNFIDTVLDALADIASDAYDYYKDHREDIVPFMEKNADPIDVANELDDMYKANDKYEDDVEQSRRDTEAEDIYPWTDEDYENYWLDDNGYVDTSNNPKKDDIVVYMDDQR